MGGPGRAVRAITAWWYLTKEEEDKLWPPKSLPPFLPGNPYMLEFQSQKYQNEDHLCSFTLLLPLCVCILMQHFITQSTLFPLLLSPLICFLIHDG